MPRKDQEIYFTAHFNRSGELIGAAPSSGAKVTEYPITQWAAENIDDIREVSIIMKPGHSPCCIKQGPYVYCWC
jgi:hypothetical protein